jgi:hypothetical protein
MPTKTLKNKKMGSRIIKFQGSPVPIVAAQNTKRGITYKLPTNLLQPKELLKAKQKNKANAAKLQEEVRRSQAIEAERQRKERLESQARFAGLVRAERERHASGRGPGVRGNGTTRKANLLIAQHTASKGKPMGKFWKKEGTNNSNSNSD